MVSLALTSLLGLIRFGSLHGSKDDPSDKKLASILPFHKALLDKEVQSTSQLETPEYTSSVVPVKSVEGTGSAWLCA
jgi:hypothetical protein